MTGSKPVALPLGDAPIADASLREPARITIDIAGWGALLSVSAALGNAARRQSSRTHPQGPSSEGPTRAWTGRGRLLGRNQHPQEPARDAHDHQAFGLRPAGGKVGWVGRLILVPPSPKTGAPVGRGSANGPAGALPRVQKLGVTDETGELIGARPAHVGAVPLVRRAVQKRRLRQATVLVKALGDQEKRVDLAAEQRRAVQIEIFRRRAPPHFEIFLEAVESFIPSRAVRQYSVS